jgi:hypothetical protein
MNRGAVLSLMAALAHRARDRRALEGYLLELMAWCTFVEHDEATARA